MTSTIEQSSAKLTFEVKEGCLGEEMAPGFPWMCRSCELDLSDDKHTHWSSTYFRGSSNETGLKYELRMTPKDVTCARTICILRTYAKMVLHQVKMREWRIARGYETADGHEEL